MSLEKEFRMHKSIKELREKVPVKKIGQLRASTFPIELTFDPLANDLRIRRAQQGISKTKETSREKETKLNPYDIPGFYRAFGKKPFDYTIKNVDELYAKLGKSPANYLINKTDYFEKWKRKSSRKI